MSELQEITTTDLEKNISPENDSIILSEKENDSDSDDDDSINMPGNENIIKVPPRPPIGSENYIIENNDPENEGWLAKIIVDDLKDLDSLSNETEEFKYSK